MLSSLIEKVRGGLQLTDRVAFYNVTHDNRGRSILGPDGLPINGRFPRGGPFGAALAISLPDGTFEIIGAARGNNVVGSGIASRHAEDQALQPDNYRALLAKLAGYNAAGLDPVVWMLSSGQSCTTCHTKQEIMARDLLRLELIRPGQFITVYGATYDETFEIAQFYDAQYADAMILFDKDPENPGNLIKHDRRKYKDVPAEVREIFAEAESPTAVVVRNGEIYAVGREERNATDLYATPEVNAVRAACIRNRESGVFESWGVDGVLYTTTSEAGPLLFAEAGWTKISTVVSVKMPADLAGKQFETQETPGLSNRKFLGLVAQGYHTPRAAIRVFCDLGYINTAQPKWAEVLAANNEILYNGAAVSDAVLAMRNLYTSDRFAAHDISSYDKPVRSLGLPARPLKTLVA
ncbi:MAG: hypothetical protein PHY92_04165 [Alphaproteobacteria bacterium]|nr:hypothetical protein [Alphaproteobacteria bacterium]